MRGAKQGVVRDGNGTVVIGATISIYLAGTLTPATAYASLTSLVPISSVTSDSSGRYAFYVDTNDYAVTQNFKIIGTHPSFTTFTIDNISCFFTSVSAVDVNGVPPRTITSNATLNPVNDGIVFIDVTSTDVTLDLGPLASVPDNNRIIWIQAIGSLDYTGYFAPSGAETINGSAGSVPLVLNEWVGLKKQSATNWQYIS